MLIYLSKLDNLFIKIKNKNKTASMSLIKYGGSSALFKMLRARLVALSVTVASGSPFFPMNHKYLSRADGERGGCRGGRRLNDKKALRARIIIRNVMRWSRDDRTQTFRRLYFHSPLHPLSLSSTWIDPHAAGAGPCRRQVITPGATLLAPQRGWRLPFSCKLLSGPVRACYPTEARLYGHFECLGAT